ncbi:MAG: hypothetical protein QXI42_12185 [Thermoproteota archaeon]|nr:hypothetical protein [Candidatus Brockarchaeota archaeon]
MRISVKKDTRLLIEGKEYSLRLDPYDPFVSTGLVVAYSTRLLKISSRSFSTPEDTAPSPRPRGS